MLTAYNRNLNAVYITEEVAFLLGLCACWITSKGDWRNLYAGLFGMSVCYASSSTVANWAIGRKLYYSGSLYDIPMVAAMAWVTWIGLRTKAEKPAADAREVSTLYGVWVARCSMIAVFSLPLFAAWSLSDSAVPAAGASVSACPDSCRRILHGHDGLHPPASAGSRTHPPLAPLAGIF